jgi:hypothetical protein
MSLWKGIFRRQKQIKYPFLKEEWRSILIDRVDFYRDLGGENRAHFEGRMLEFLNTTHITGVQTEVEDEDLVLLSASAIIPIFAFPNWSYTNLDEVLLFPAHFDHGFEIGSKDMAILGMVGYGYMEGKMILSKKSLHHGFDNNTDKQNTAIHEFVHLLDKQDGAVDGIPVHLISKDGVLPWLNLIDAKIQEIRNGESDIRSYGATNRAEFLAVVAEYFFERPQLLAKKHPDLYRTMEQLFGQKLSGKLRSKRPAATEHYEKCPCGSGQKFRNCCKGYRR